MLRLSLRQICDDELPQAIALLAMLNADVSESEVAERLRRILFEHPHYRFYGAFDGDRMLGVCGAWIATKVWCGRYLEVDNLVVDPNQRSRGVGTQLLDFMEQIGRESDCRILVLDSYTSNYSSHRLYHRLNYEIKGFHFVKMLGGHPGALVSA